MKTNKKPLTLPITLPVLPALNLPVTFSTTQPLPGVSLDVQSILRDLLERNLPPSTIRSV